MTVVMRWSRSRVQVFGALAAVGAGVFVAVASALGTHTPSVGVAAAEATRLQPVTHVVSVGGARLAVTTKPNGDVCYRGGGLQACASSLGSARLSYATGRSGGRPVVGGVAGRSVRAVILKLTGKGVVWPTLRQGAFYAVLPRGRRLRAVAKVLPGGHRVTYPAS
jgi:hypothetical protein